MKQVVSWNVPMSGPLLVITLYFLNFNFKVIYFLTKSSIANLQLLKTNFYYFEILILVEI